MELQYRQHYYQIVDEILAKIDNFEAVLGFTRMKQIL